MTCTSDTVRTHLQRCRTLGEGLLNLCAHHTHTQAVHIDLSPHRRSPACVRDLNPRQLRLAERQVGDVTATPIHHPSCMRAYMRACVRVCACLWECMCECVRACLSTCFCTSVCVCVRE